MQGTAHISASPSEASGAESDSGGGEEGRRLSAAPAASKRLMVWKVAPMMCPCIPPAGDILEEPHAQAGWSDDDDSDNGQPGGRASGGPAAGKGIEKKDSSDANESSDEEGRSMGTADRQPDARKQSSVGVAEPKQGTALRVVSSDDEEAEKVSAGGLWAASSARWKTGSCLKLSGLTAQGMSTATMILLQKFQGGDERAPLSCWGLRLMSEEPPHSGLLLRMVSLRHSQLVTESV